MQATYSIRKFSDNTTVKRPKELGCFSRDIDNKISIDDSQLSYYYLPDNDLNGNEGIDLSSGFSKFKKNPNLDYGDFTGLLGSIIKYEKEHKKKISSKIITWRGLMRTLMLLPYENRDKFLYNIVVFDGQLFIQSDIEYRKFIEENEKVNDIQKKFIYSGYKFETIATLPKPWSQCTRKEIEKRNKLEVNNIEQYAVIVKTTIGSTSLLLGAEVDCVYDYKPTDGTDTLSHYVELKTTGPLNDPNKVTQFENKLLKTWAQCFLVGIPKIIYAFRDASLRIRSIEEFKTEEIPLLIKNNPMNVEKHQQNPNLKVINKSMQSIKFLSGILNWLEETIPLNDESKTYRLEFDPFKNSMFVNLSENTDQITSRLLSPYNGENGGMLTEEFKQWRKELKSIKV
jgi:RAT1-interacting protein